MMWRSEEGAGAPESGVTGDNELPGVHAGYQTLVLYKISKCSCPLRYFSRPWGWAIKTSKSVSVTHFLQGGSTFERFHNLLGEASHHWWDQVFNNLTLQGKVHMKSTEKGCQFCSKAEMVFPCPAWEWEIVRVYHLCDVSAPCWVSRSL